MASGVTRSHKVKKIFQQFDANQDGGLNRNEMAALVIAVNPRVKFSSEQINAILDEVFRTYGEFIDGDDKGLTFEGLLRTYDDGAGDVDRDFDALGLELDSATISVACSSSIADERAEPHRKQRVAAWASSPKHGIVFEGTWKIIDDLEILIKRLKVKMKGENVGDVFSDPGWSRELGPESEGGVLKRVYWEKQEHEHEYEHGHDYGVFVKELNVLRSRADGSRPKEEAFDGHMAIGRTLFDHHLLKEALVSFKRACELQPTEVRPHFRAGNTLYGLGRFSEARVELGTALEVAELSGNQWSYLLPQIHVNLGIALEGEGMVLSSCEHYREAAILCPTHFRALKLLGSALLGVGEYRAAERALEEAIFLRSDFVDAHCDLGSSLHAMGEDERAIQEFQKAIDLRPDHVDALYNLGGLFMDMGRYQRASEMYTRVLAIWPGHWRAQLNKGVALLGAGETEEARKALKEAFKMTNRVELYDTITHVKLLQKKPAKGASSDGEGEGGFVVVEPPKFKRVGRKTTPRQNLANALEIRAFQRLTRLNRCDVDVLKKELGEANVPVTYSGSGVPEKSIRKAALEEILRKLLLFLKPETFQGSVKAINQRVLGVLDGSGSGRVDFGMFLAVIVPICAGPLDKRKRAVFDALLSRPVNEMGTQIRKTDAIAYIKFLRAIYIPSLGMSDMMEVHGEADNSMVSFPEFLEMFDDPDWGFGIIDTLVKLETSDRTRHGRQSCAVCRYPIIGPRFKEINSSFSLCNICYSEGKVPSSFKQEEYRFREYGRESEAIKDKCSCFNFHSKSSENNP